MWTLILTALCVFMLYQASVYFRAERFFAAIGALVGSMLFALGLYANFQLGEAEKRLVEVEKFVSAPDNTDEAKIDSVKKKETEKAKAEIANAFEEDVRSEPDFGAPAIDTKPSAEIEP